VLGFTALLRTARAWYAWQHDAGGPAPGLAETECGWRHDNRLFVTIRPCAVNDRPSAVPSRAGTGEPGDPMPDYLVACVAALEQAFDAN
jgi:hypothetical protein